MSVEAGAKNDEIGRLPIDTRQNETPAPRNCAPSPFASGALTIVLCAGFAHCARAGIERHLMREA
jgi:hypothetical protein